MQTRRFGRTGHDSTVAIFGAAALGRVTQAEADDTMKRIIAAGVNHIDVAPSYGEAELRIGPWMERERQTIFPRLQDDGANEGRRCRRAARLVAASACGLV